MRPLAVLPFVLAAAALVGVPAASAQVTQAACEGAPAPVLFAEWESSLENLAFDGAGSLFVSDVGNAKLVRFAPDGSSTIAYNGDIHGLVWGADSRLYTTQLSGEDTWDVLRSTDASVTAFDVYARGLPTYNGMAFDGAGNLYVSDDSVGPPNEAVDFVRVPAADPMRWTPWTALYGPNGLAYDAPSDKIYTVITADQSSPVLRLSTTDPAAYEVVTYLSGGVATLEPNVHPPQGDPVYPVPKGLDDLTIGLDGRLYIVGHLSGELLRVDPATGDACLLASGLEEPTSARFARGFGPHGGKLFVTTWGGTGVTGIAMGQADQHPAGKVWMFDLGFPEPPAPAQASPPPTPTSTPGPIDGDGVDPPATGAGDAKKDTPLGPVALLALALGALLARRRG